MLIMYVLNILIDLTKCEREVFGREDERSDFAIQNLVAYERACSHNDNHFWEWINTRVLLLTNINIEHDVECAKRVYAELKLILKFILNLTGVDDNECVKYFMDLALKGLLIHLLSWNTPK
jgi:hypothetical protein